MTDTDGQGRDGTILTFYSYKGGTGRTMALANVAWILASAGKRVLMVDWDLEAPGLHRFFHPFLVDKELVASPGLIDLVWEFSLETMRRTDGEVAANWYEPLANVAPYVTSIEWKSFKNNGGIDLLPAGKQGSSYSTRVNAFDWRNFYEERGGGTFLNAVRENMRHSYDYVLIDSRTGVSDTSGVCTVQMPDALVVCFTLSTQGIEGGASAAASVANQRTEAPFPIFPVPMRIEDGEQSKLEAGRQLARTKFGTLVKRLVDVDPARYWGEVELPYRRFYAYEEILATFGDRPHQPNSVLGAVERLTAYITQHDVTKLDPPSDEERRAVMLQFERGAGATLSAYEKGLAAFAAGDLGIARTAFQQAYEDAQTRERPDLAVSAALQLSAVATQAGDALEAETWIHRAAPPQREMRPSPEPPLEDPGELAGYVHRRWETLSAHAMRRVFFGGGLSLSREAAMIIATAHDAYKELHTGEPRESVAKLQLRDLIRTIPSSVREAFRFASVLYFMLAVLLVAVGGYVGSSGSSAWFNVAVGCWTAAAGVFTAASLTLSRGRRVARQLEGRD